MYKLFLALTLKSWNRGINSLVKDRTVCGGGVRFDLLRLAPLIIHIAIVFFFPLNFFSTVCLCLCVSDELRWFRESSKRRMWRCRFGRKTTTAAADCKRSPRENVQTTVLPRPDRSVHVQGPSYDWTTAIQRRGDEGSRPDSFPAGEVSRAVFLVFETIGWASRMSSHPTLTTFRCAWFPDLMLLAQKVVGLIISTLLGVHGRLFRPD